MNRLQFLKALAGIVAAALIPLTAKTEAEMVFGANDFTKNWRINNEPLTTPDSVESVAKDFARAFARRIDSGFLRELAASEFPANGVIDVIGWGDRSDI